MTFTLFIIFCIVWSLEKNKYILTFICGNYFFDLVLCIVINSCHILSYVTLLSYFFISNFMQIKNAFCNAIYKKLHEKIFIWYFIVIAVSTIMIMSNLQYDLKKVIFKFLYASICNAYILSKCSYRISNTVESWKSECQKSKVLLNLRCQK